MTIDEERLRYLALKGAAWDRAHGQIGIYAQKTIYADGTEKLRTEREDGWNACSIEHAKRATRFMAWLSTLPDEHKTTVEDLLLSDRLNVTFEAETIGMWVDCSDTFFWGCADGEDITFAEIPDLIECWRLSPTQGGDLWCCRKRGMRPQTACYGARYQPNEWPLFDAAGPERDDPDGRGRAELVVQ